MAGPQKSFQYIIEANMDQMTAAEKTAAEYFLTAGESEDFTAAAVTKKLGISMAALSRFAKKCGLSGYREFLALYKNSFIRAGKVQDENNRMVFWSYQEILNRQYSLVDEAQITRIAAAMSGCRHLYIAGRGNSGLAAEEMANRYKWLGVDASCVKDTEEMKLTTLFLDKEDMVIGLSISGRQPELLYLLDEAEKKGCCTVLGTGNSSKILAARVTERVLVPSLKNLNYGNLISPQLPLLLLGDMIYGEYVAQNEASATESQKRVRKALYGDKE